MIRDAAGIEPGAELSADVCIVGAGAAGITVARDLRGRGLRVLLIEGGGFDFEEEVQALNEGEMTGIGDVGLTRCRVRQFGGTTTRWAGWCRPLDSIIFEERGWMPHSGWPLTREALVPWYKQAQRTVQIGGFEYDVATLATRAELPTLAVPGVEEFIYQYSPPTRFGLTYRSDLEAAQDLDVILHAQLVDIRLAEAGGAVASLAFKTLAGGAFTVTADQFVLALGGLETPRALLAANSQEPAGVGNHSDWVGRGFMEHPHFYVTGVLLLADPPEDLSLHTRRTRVPTRDDFEPGSRDVSIRVAIGVPEAVREARGWPTFGATLRALNAEQANERVGGLPTEALRGLMRTESVAALGLDIRAEQRPLRDSRVTLTDELDAVGIPKLELDWQVAREDLDAYTRSLEYLAGAFGASGRARLWLPLDGDGLLRPHHWEGGCHHMGTARMAADPANGVVDADCRVHGLANLYLASSAVFPTAGFANPTLTIVALAHRLAEHLGGRS